MLSRMISETPQQVAAVGGAAVTEPLEDASTGAPAERENGVSWHLSPGYSTHLHAYELAMLPSDRRAARARR